MSPVTRPLAAMLALLLVFSGCATGTRPEKSADDVAMTVAAWGDALVAHDIDKVMSHFSEDFSHYEYGDREGMRAFLEDSVDTGYLDDAELNLDRTVVSVEDDVATVSGIELDAAFGYATIWVKLNEGAGAWKVTSLDVNQY